MLNTIGKVSFEINIPAEITVIIQGSLKKAEKFSETATRVHMQFDKKQLR